MTTPGRRRSTESPVAAPPSEASPVWLRITTENHDSVAEIYAGVAVHGIDQMAPGPCLVTAELGVCSGVTVFRESCTASTQTWSTFRQPSYAVVVPLEPFQGGRYYGQDIRDTSVLTLEPGSDLWLVVPGGADHAGIAMPDAVVLRYAESLQIAREEHLRGAPRLIDLPLHRIQALRRFDLSLLTSLEHHQDNRLSPLAIGQIEETAAVLLICAFLGRSRVRGAGRPRSSYERIAREARDLVMSRPKHPPTLVELCEHLHVGVRALNYAFQHAVGTSAGDYLRVVRLNRVREELLAARGGGRVLLSQIASRWGFWHASQFTRQYRALFGERPSETLRSAETPHAPLAPTTGRAPAPDPLRARIRGRS